MTALAAPLAGFSPSSALRIAQFEGRGAALHSSRPLLDVLGFLRSLATSPFSARLEANSEPAFQTTVRVTIADGLEVEAPLLPRGIDFALGTRPEGTVEKAFKAATQYTAPARSTRDLVRALRGNGMPISGIAEVVGVQRKTVYSWLNEEVVADSRNHDRLQAIADLLRDEPQGSLQFLARHWERQLEGGGNLKAILSAEILDSRRAREAMNWLRPAILRSIKQNSRDVRAASATIAPSLTEYLEAVTK